MQTQRYFSRNEAADLIKARGLSITRNTLQKYATVGGGPVYRRFGNRAVYLEQDLDAWIQEKLSAPRCSTSEAVAA